MATVIGVRFRNTCKVYYFDPAELSIKKGDRVVVETARGVELGEVAMGRTEVSDAGVVKPLKTVMRLATKEDLDRDARHRRQEKAAFEAASARIAERGLEMKLVSAEYSFDDSKVLFYFTADGRIDFRELVKDLAGQFRRRIELRQIGVRDESKMIGGLGICGRPFCCAQFMGDFQPVSIKMAKEQGLSLNPTKLSGTCGRLMCCLKHEQEAYESLIREQPLVESLVETADGPGRVVEVNLLRATVKVQLKADSEGTPRAYRSADVKVTCRGKGDKKSRGGEKGGEKSAE